MMTMTKSKQNKNIWFFIVATVFATVMILASTAPIVATTTTTIDSNNIGATTHKFIHDENENNILNEERRRLRRNKNREEQKQPKHQRQRRQQRQTVINSNETKNNHVALKHQQHEGEPARSLQEDLPAMEFISQNIEDNTITVRLHQVLFGSVDKCGTNANIPEDVAKTMFAIYNNAEASGQPYCNFYYQKDACFTDDIVVACDAETNEATVELITRDTYHLDRFNDRVANPKVKHVNGGTCVGPLDTVGNAVSTKMTFDCSSPDSDSDPIDTNADGPCETDEQCPSYQWCSEKYDLEFGGGFLGYFCKTYAAVGEPCGSGGFIPPGTEGRCAPAGSFDDNDEGSVCVNKQSCTGFGDAGGTCVATFGSCTSNNACDSRDQYCSNGICYAKLSNGDCCTPGSGIDECATGVCTLLFDGPFGSAYTCQ